MITDLALRQRTEAHTEQPRRDFIGFILLHRIDLTDQHPGVMLALVALVILVGGALEQAMP